MSRIEEVVALMEERHRPEVIPVPTHSGTLVIMRNPTMPEYGFLIWGDGRYGSLQLRHCQGISSEFRIADVLEEIEFGGHPFADQYKDMPPATKVNLVAEFVTRLENLCKEKGVRVLFVGHEGYWFAHFGRWPKGVHLVGPAQSACEMVMSVLYPRVRFQEAFPCIVPQSSIRDGRIE